MMDGWDMTGWGWFWMSLSMAIGVAVLALLVVLVVRASAPADRRTDDDALAVVRRRYASGEIDLDEYRRRSAELQKSS